MSQESRALILDDFVCPRTGTFCQNFQVGNVSFFIFQVPGTYEFCFGVSLRMPHIWEYFVLSDRVSRCVGTLQRAYKYILRRIHDKIYK